MNYIWIFVIWNTQIAPFRTLCFYVEYCELGVTLIEKGINLRKSAYLLKHCRHINYAWTNIKTNMNLHSKNWVFPPRAKLFKQQIIPKAIANLTLHLHAQSLKQDPKRTYINKKFAINRCLIDRSCRHLINEPNLMSLTRLTWSLSVSCTTTLRALTSTVQVTKVGCGGKLQFTGLNLTNQPARMTKVKLNL